MLENDHHIAKNQEQNTDSVLGWEKERFARYEEACCEEFEQGEDGYIPKKSSHLWGIGYWDSVYDMETDTAVAVDKLVDVCPENLEDLVPGEQLLIVRDEENDRRLRVCRVNGAPVGKLHWTNCVAMIPMLEDGTIKQIELKVHSIQTGLIQVQIIAAFQGLIQCTIPWKVVPIKWVSCPVL